MLAGGLLKSSPTGDNEAILEKLIQLRAATPIQIELETQQNAQVVKIHLEELERSGWVESMPDSSGLEEKVFYPSAKAYVRLLEENRQTKKPSSYRLRSQSTSQFGSWNSK